MLASTYRATPPDERAIAAELDRPRRMLELGTPSNEDKAVGINTTRDRIRQTLVRCTRHLTKHAIESSCEADGEAISALQARENPAAA